MFRQILCTLALVLIASMPVLAQEEVPKVEIFGGYSWAGGNFHGWNGSVTGNVNKWFGLTADASGHYGSEQEGPILVKENAHTAQFGPRFSHRGKRFTPFVYALVGATRFHQSATINGVHLTRSDTGFTTTVGGGLDITVNDRVAIRAFQLDYFRPNFFGEAHNRGRLAFGLVFRLGKR
jgi:opacity protein-like surface antigen